MNMFEVFSLIFSVLLFHSAYCVKPIVINTWTFPEAAKRAWEYLEKGHGSIDALEAGCSLCEVMQCGLTVGYGGSPDESGETTLDALIFDGATMDAGAVGDLRRVKSAISVAKYVLQHTHNTLIVGDQATKFATEMGFKEETLSTNVSTQIWKDWKLNSCQPNYWKNVEPDSYENCGPYSPLSENSIYYKTGPKGVDIDVFRNHDTIGMIVLDATSHIVAGASTNGLRHKIAGRVGDSPIPGAGAYADNEVGASCATGDGDIMMRFLPSFLAVEEMRRGNTPEEAAKVAITRITKHYPSFSGAVIAINIDGIYGAACNGMTEFPFSVMKPDQNEVVIETVSCSNI